MDEETAAVPVPARPAATAVLQQWTTFFAEPLLSGPHLANEAMLGRVPARGLRSLHWRFYLGCLPAPSSSTPPALTTTHLARTRSEFAQLRVRLLSSPEGAVPSPLELQVNNPLSLETDNSWLAWFAQLEVRREIQLDVQRTFPDQAYFRQPHVQDALTNLLHLYAQLTEFGYRQGMHEILAPIFQAVDQDSLEGGDSLAAVVLAREFVHHDAWTLFSAVMKAAVTYYEPTPSVPLPLARRATTSATTSLTLNHAAGSTSSAPGAEAQVLVQPVVAVAIRVHDVLLRGIDPELHAELEELGIEPQLFLVRWLRCLFGRELPYAQDMLLWDGLFALDASLRIVEYVCVAMLLRVRAALLLSDYSGALTILLRYPAPLASPDDFKIPLLLQQAVFLRDNVSPPAGHLCNEQNIEYGAVAGEASGRRRQTRAPPAASPAPGVLAEGGGLVGEIAKGVYGRAEALGINRALLNTFYDVKRPAVERDQLSEVLSRAPSTTRFPAPVTPTPSPSTLPSPLPTSSDLRALQAQNVEMSRGIGASVDVLAAALGEGAERETLQALAALRSFQAALAVSAGVSIPVVRVETPKSLPSLPATPPLESGPLAPSSTPPLLLGSRTNQPRSFLTRIPHTRPTSAPPSPNIAPVPTRPLAKSPTLAPVRQFPSASFSTRASFGQKDGKGAVYDPLGALG